MIRRCVVGPYRLAPRFIRDIEIVTGRALADAGRWWPVAAVLILEPGDLGLIGLTIVAPQPLPEATRDRVGRALMDAGVDHTEWTHEKVGFGWSRSAGVVFAACDAAIETLLRDEG